MTFEAILDTSGCTSGVPSFSIDDSSSTLFDSTGGATYSILGMQVEVTLSQNYYL